MGTTISRFMSFLARFLSSPSFGEQKGLIGGWKPGFA